MKLLETCVVHHDSELRYVKLYVGDLAAIPPVEAVDLLIVSAFPNDYIPTRTSLIGALYRRGVSVELLAREKAVDLRDVFSCWLSKDILFEPPGLGFKRILCFEPLTRGNPAELVGDIFRAVMPFALSEPPIKSIAMPVLASGDQRFDEAVMLRSLFDAAVHWLARGLPVETIKIVVYSEDSANRLRSVFAELRAKLPKPGPGHRETDVRNADLPHDCFVNYSHADGDVVGELIDYLHAARPALRVFQDKLELKTGDAWQAELDWALESCRKVIAVYSPSYLQSKMCMEEFNMARIRHRESKAGVLLPIYLRSATLPLYMRSLQYIDCREADVNRIRSSCQGPLLVALD